MTTNAQVVTDTSRAAGRPFPAIVVGGVIVGILDLTYAIVVYSPKRPILIPQAIATGVLGRASFSDGARSALLGVILHFVIALGAATVYYLASRKWRFLVDRPVIAGMIFGAGVSGDALRDHPAVGGGAEPHVVRAQERGVRGTLVLRGAADLVLGEEIRRLTVARPNRHTSRLSPGRAAEKRLSEKR